MKISIIGYSGSGKSTLAALMGQMRQLPVLFLDTVQFTSHWQERNREEALVMVKTFMEQDDWIIEGNYTFFLQEERLCQSDLIFFLSFSRAACFARVCRRFFKNRGAVRESMAPGCEEKLDWEFVKWVLIEQRNKDNKEHFSRIAEQYKEKLIVIKNQRQLDKLKDSLSAILAN